ncbi:MAG: spondin domain-containing protein [Sphingomonadales bacterium]
MSHTLRPPHLGRVLAGAVLLTVFGASAQAAQIRVTVENLAPSDGFSLTPVYLGFHNGSFDLFNIGEAASPGLEVVAEEGGPFSNTPEAMGMGGGVANERLAADPNSQGGVIAAPEGFPGAPVIEPGEIGTAIITINDPTDQRFLTYVSMVISSNDAFIGNEAPIELFEDAGNFLGDVDILVTGNSIYDAGTEENDATDGPAFAPGFPRGSGTPTVNGVVTLHEGLGDILGAGTFAGLEQPNGAILGADAIDFVTDRAGFQLARITITEVPEPSSFALLGAGMLGLGTLRRKRLA